MKKAKAKRIHGVRVSNEPKFDKLLRAVRAVCIASGKWDDRERRNAIRECWKAMGAKVPVTVPVQIQHIDEDYSWVQVPTPLLKEIRAAAPDGQEEGTKDLKAFIKELLRHAWESRTSGQQDPGNVIDNKMKEPVAQRRARLRVIKRPSYTKLMRAVVSVCLASRDLDEDARQKAVRVCWAALGYKVPQTTTIETRNDDGYSRVADDAVPAPGGNPVI